MYASDYSKNLITAEEKVAELMKQRDKARKVETELVNLRAEVRQARRAWLGGDYDHLELIEAMEKFRNDRETEFDAAEAECIALRSRAEKAEERLEWLERFLQGGGTSINTVSYYTVENHPDDTDETRFNMPFHIGMNVETENRGCYKWVEFSNGAKGICPAIDAAKIKYDEWRREQF
jgi:hypothetical protein